MRKAVIVPFALGTVLMSGLFLFGGSVADEMLLKNRYFKLKEFTEKAAIAAANYYSVDQDRQNAQQKTLSLMSSNPIYDSVANEVEFIWRDSDEVTVGIDKDRFQPFWLKMFGMDAINIEDVNSTAQIVDAPDAISDTTKEFVPIAINERDIVPGDILRLKYQVLECDRVKCCDFESGFSAGMSFGGGHCGGSFNFASTCTNVSVVWSHHGGGHCGGGAVATKTCAQGFPWSLSATFSNRYNWREDDHDHFYGIDLEADDTLQNGVSHNAHWRKYISRTKQTPHHSYNAWINLLKMDSDVRFLCGSTGGCAQTSQLQLAVNAFKKLKGEIFDIALVNDKAEISGFVTVRLKRVRSRNGSNGYLKIVLEVLENQNNKQVRLVD